MTEPSKHPPARARRRSYPETLKGQVVGEIDSSGQSAAVVAKRHGLRPGLVRRWWRERSPQSPDTLNRHRTQWPESGSPDFIPLTVATQSNAPHHSVVADGTGGDLLHPRSSHVRVTLGLTAFADGATRDMRPTGHPDTRVVLDWPLQATDQLAVFLNTLRS